VSPLHWRDKLSCIAQKGGPLHDRIKGETERMSKNDTEEDGERLLRPSRSITCETWVIDEAMTGPGMMPAIPSLTGNVRNKYRFMWTNGCVGGDSFTSGRNSGSACPTAWTRQE
jgi:hypothetical protein